MLQLSVLLILFSINELKWVAAAPRANPIVVTDDENADDVQTPTPMFTGYDDFQKRHKEYNTSLYYFISTRDKTACACQERVVFCYTQGRTKVHVVKLADGTRFGKTVETQDDFDCIACLAQPNVLFTETQCNPKLQFPVGKYLSTELPEYQSTDRSFITADLAIVQNFSNVTQTGMTTSYAKHVSETVSISFTLGLKISASTKLKVPLVSELTLGIEISGSVSRTKSKTMATTVTAPPQVVSLPPNRSIIVHYSVYRATVVSECSLNFGIDYRTDTKNPNTDPNRFDLIERGVRSGYYHINFYPHPNKAGLLLTQDGQFELRNFPVVEMKQGHEVVIEFSKDRPVHGQDDPGPYDDELKMMTRRKVLKKPTSRL